MLIPSFIDKSLIRIRDINNMTNMRTAKQMFNFSFKRFSYPTIFITYHMQELAQKVFYSATCRFTMTRAACTGGRTKMINVATASGTI